MTCVIGHLSSTHSKITDFNLVKLFNHLVFILQQFHSSMRSLIFILLLTHFTTVVKLLTSPGIFREVEITEISVSYAYSGWAQSRYTVLIE